MTSINESIIVDSSLTLILLIASISNCLLLFVFHQRPGLRTISNRFVINLLVTNLITCWTLLPMVLFDGIWRRTGPTACRFAPLCVISEGVTITLYTATILSVLMIGIDQYFAVLDPLRYHNCITTGTSSLMIGTAWCMSAVIGVLGSVTASDKSAWYLCKLHHFEFLPQYRMAFPVAFIIVAFLIPFLAVCWIYISICLAARNNSLRTKMNGSGPEDYTIIATIHECVEYKIPKPLHHSSTKSSLKSTSSSLVSTLKHRISNASMFRYREETRAARVSILVIIMALCCWLPFAIIMLLKSPLFNVSIPHYIKQTGVLSLTCNAVMSPLIFAHRNRRVHRELCKLFRSSKRGSSFYGNVRHPIKRTKTIKPTPIDVKEKSMDVLISMPTEEPAQPEQKSFLRRIWTFRKSKLNLPAIALEPDTSRSSFSSNASTTSNHRSMSAASISDVIEEV